MPGLSLTPCMLGDFSRFYCHLTFFKINVFKKNSGTLSDCQIVWVQIKFRHSVGPELSPNCLQRQKSPLARKEIISRQIGLKINVLKKNYSGTLSDCQIVWVQVKFRHSVGPELSPNCLQRQKSPQARTELISRQIGLNNVYTDQTASNSSKLSEYVLNWPF